MVHRRHPVPHLATLDHLRSRLDPERGSDWQESTVLACWECNHRRGAEEVKSKLSLEEQRERAKSWPVASVVAETFRAFNAVNAPQLGVYGRRWVAARAFYRARTLAEAGR